MLFILHELIRITNLLVTLAYEYQRKQQQGIAFGTTSALIPAPRGKHVAESRPKHADFTFLVLYIILKYKPLDQVCCCRYGSNDPAVAYGPLQECKVYSHNRSSASDGTSEWHGKPLHCSSHTCAISSAAAPCLNIVTLWSSLLLTYRLATVRPQWYPVSSILRNA